MPVLGCFTPNTMASWQHAQLNMRHDRCREHAVLCTVDKKLAYTRHCHSLLGSTEVPLYWNSLHAMAFCQLTTCVIVVLTVAFRLTGGKLAFSYSSVTDGKNCTHKLTLVPRKMLMVSCATVYGALTVVQQRLHVRASVPQVWTNCKRVSIFFLAHQRAFAAKCVLSEGLKNFVLSLAHTYSTFVLRGLPN